MKTLQEILSEVYDRTQPSETLEQDLLAWAKAYGEEVRNAVRDECLGWEGASTLTDRLRDMPLPEPK